jgi:hypothetical protein
LASGLEGVLEQALHYSMNYEGALNRTKKHIFTIASLVFLFSVFQPSLCECVHDGMYHHNIPNQVLIGKSIIIWFSRIYQDLLQ